MAGRQVVLLDAPAYVLAQRCADKFGSPPEEEFLEKLRSRFTNVFRQLPNVAVVDASQSLDAVIEKVRAFLPSR